MEIILKSQATQLANFLIKLYGPLKFPGMMIFKVNLFPITFVRAHIQQLDRVSFFSKCESVPIFMHPFLGLPYLYKRFQALFSWSML